MDSYPVHVARQRLVTAVKLPLSGIEVAQQIAGLL